MSKIKVRAVARTNPKNPQAKNKFYAKLVQTRLDPEDFEKDLAGRSSLTAGDSQNHFQQMFELFPQYLANGHIVPMGKMGFFRLKANSEGKETEAEVGVRSIKKTEIVFQVSKEFQEQVPTIHIEKEKSPVKEGEKAEEKPADLLKS